MVVFIYAKGHIAYFVAVLIAQARGDIFVNDPYSKLQHIKHSKGFPFYHNTFHKLMPCKQTHEKICTCLPLLTFLTIYTKSCVHLSFLIITLLSVTGTSIHQ